MDNLLPQISGGSTILKDKPPRAGKVYCDTQKND